MIQMTLSLLATRATRPDIVQTPEIPVAASIADGSISKITDLVDVSEAAQDAGIPYKMAITNELYERLQRCHPGDLYENEVVLWNVLWLGEFERTLNSLVPAFAFTATLPSANGGNECTRLRYVAGDPAVIEMAD
jgi:hypothetical protein